MAKTTTTKDGKKKKKIKNKRYPCNICGKIFYESSSRNRHMPLHSAERPYSCDLCSHTCKTKKYLAKHVRVVHKPATKHQCDMCNKSFHFKCLLEKHILVHTKEKPYKCNVCGKAFNAKYSLTGHMFIHQDLKPYKCQFCEYACRDSSTLRKHEHRHMGIVNRYSCKICDKRFDLKTKLKRHVDEVHMKLDVRKVPCDQCDKKFKTRSVLTTHIKTVHLKKMVAACEICGMKIASRYNMNAHLMSHVDAKPFKCAFAGCQKRYKDLGTLKKHSILHYPQRQYPCGQCGRRFTRKERLRRHEATHARTQRVRCGHCGVRFYSKNYLIVHIRKKHSPKKLKFICDLCDFETTNKPSIVMHINSHGRKMNLECDVCGKKYKDEKWLKRHCLLAHRNSEIESGADLLAVIKEEPVDDDEQVQYEMFTVEKEEVLQDLEPQGSSHRSPGLVLPGSDDYDKSAGNAENSNDNLGEEHNMELEGNSNNNVHKEHTDDEDNTNNCVGEQHHIGYAKRASINVKHRTDDFDILNNGTKEKHTPVLEYILQNNERQDVRNVECSINVEQNAHITTGDVRTDESTIGDLQTDEHTIGDVQNHEYTTDDDDEQNGGNVEYSKAVLAEDITRCMTSANKSGNVFDSFLFEHIVEKEKPQERIEKIDVDSQKYAKEYLDGLLKEARKEKEVISIENARQIYNERIKNAERLRKENIKIQYMNKPNANADLRRQNATKVQSKNSTLTHEVDDRDNNTDSEGRNVTDIIQSIPAGKDCSGNTSKRNISVNDKKQIRDKGDDNSAGGKETEISNKVATRNRGKEIAKPVDVTNDSDDMGEGDGAIVGEKETRLEVSDRIRRSVKKKYCDDEWVLGDEGKAGGSNKIKINSQQCYVCFKLFNSQDELIDHCKIHFDVTNSMTLKKCPLCDFVTKFNVTRHMKMMHKVNINIPCTKLREDTSSCNAQYCYEVNSAEINNIEVIPSVRLLNKKAYVAIDKRNRELKDVGVEKKKLVKKGGEWVIEKETGNLRDVNQYILPTFSRQEMAKVKLDKAETNDYLRGLKKLYKLAKKRKKKMLFPCEVCEKICQTLSALKLHCRRHSIDPKPFKKKVWKHKAEVVKRKTNVRLMGYTKGRRVFEVDAINLDVNKNTETDATNAGGNENDTERGAVEEDRYKKPNPIMNKHKCDPKLMDFYENNIKGADIQFWQFLKIFNRMSRENVNDFEDLADRPEFGIHFDPKVVLEDIDPNAGDTVGTSQQIERIPERRTNLPKVPTPKQKAAHPFRGSIRFSKMERLQRKALKEKLREKIAKESKNKV